MGIATLLRFLFGGGQAISDVATCRGALWVGALFVLSAGFAREYNQEDLLRDPWYVLIPLVASLATSFVLFALLALAASNRAISPIPFLPYYRAFLSLYCMTAPLAWLYALPVEHYLSAADSVRVNLSLLGIVSLWRVLLITRCASVLLGSSYLAAFFLVMFFADTLALVILFFTPLPVFNIMGGIPLTESEAVIRRVACDVQGYGALSWLVWFIGSLVVVWSQKREWTPLQLTYETAGRVSKLLWALVVAALLVWIVVLPTTQPPQQLRRAVEADLLDDRIGAGLQTMSAHERDDFPPHWDPPPWHGYGQDKPPLLKVLQAIDEKKTAEWVEEIYFEKFARHFRYLSWRSMDDETFAVTMKLLRNPRYHDIVRQNAQTLRGLVEYQYDDNPKRRVEILELLRDLEIDTSIEAGAESNASVDDAGLSENSADDR